MSLAFATAAQRFEAALEAYRQGRPGDAVRLLDAVLQSEPRSAPAHHLMGVSLAALRELEGAERALRTSLSIDKRRPAVHGDLGEVLQQMGGAAEAEKAYRAGLALDRRHRACISGLAGLLLNLGRPQEALQITAPLVVGADAPAEALSLHAAAQRSVGRLEAALETGLRAVAAGAPAGELALAATFRDLARYNEAEAAARRGVEALERHPAALGLWGRTLADLDRHDEAEAAYREALTKAPFDPSAHQALAELLWARSGDPARAVAALDSVLRQRATAPLLALRARLHTRAGEARAGLGLLLTALSSAPDDPLLNAAAATAAVEAGQPAAGLAYAELAASLAPGVPKIDTLLAETRLAAGAPDRAAEIAGKLRRQRPEDQQFVALEATAWRLLGDARYRELYDYEAMVRAFTLPTPQGWASLDAFLADLAEALTARQTMRGDPLEQSVRKGVQTEQNLALSDDPVLRAFFQAAEAPIREYIAGLGKGQDPLRARAGRGHQIKSAWSVRLDPGGFHADHLHPDGWISSAFYVALPKAMAGAQQAKGREGWIRFGQPGVPTTPTLEAEHYVQPEPGRLVLFPSYMWHGTVPFSGDETRLTMAFDVVPKD